MREYRETALTGKQFTRCKGVQIINELGATQRTVLFHEETVAVMGAKTMSEPMGAIAAAMTAENQHTEFDIIDFETMQPTGRKATYAEAYALMASLYMHTAQMRDAEEIRMAEQAETQRLEDIRRQEAQAEAARLQVEAEEAARKEQVRLAQESQKAMDKAQADVEAAQAAQQRMDADMAAQVAAEKAERERAEAERAVAEREAAEAEAARIAAEAQAASAAAAASSAASE